MSASDIILAAGSAAVGVAAGSLLIYAYSRGFTDRNETLKTPPPSSSLGEITSSSSEKKQEQSSGENIEHGAASELLNRDQIRSIPRSELERSKRELRTLLVEKELVSAALTRLYEAEAAKEITKSEREVLGAKYVAELKVLDDKITKMDAFIQIGDLETLRNQLLQLVEQKIDSIERRIESTRKFAEPLIAEMMNRQQSTPNVLQQQVSVDETQRGTPVPDISDMLENEKPEPRIDPTAEPQTVIANAPLAPSDPQKILSASVAIDRKKPADKVEELQKEILEALDRLERLDVDSA